MNKTPPNLRRNKISGKVYWSVYDADQFSTYITTDVAVDCQLKIVRLTNTGEISILQAIRNFTNNEYNSGEIRSN